MPQTLQTPVSPRVAILAFNRLADAWELTNDQRAALLGVAPRTVRRYAAEGPPYACDRNTLERISHLVNLWGALRSLYRTESGARRWLTSAHESFGGSAPLARMLAGNVSDILAVRAEVESGANA